MATSGQQQYIKPLDKKDMENISIINATTFNGKVKQDEWRCIFAGIICLQDGRLLLLDYNNKLLKMFKSDFKVICTEPTKVQGHGMTKVSEQEIAVVGERTVYFYTITNDGFVIQDRVFNLDGVGNGISYNRGRYAVACDVLSSKDQPFIKICSDNGTEIHRITSFKNKPSNIINLNSVEDCLYVSPYYTHDKFTCLSLQGQLLWEMDFLGIDVVELYNCLLVTDTKHTAIYVCTKDGKYRRKLAAVPCAEYMAYNPDKQQIFITHLQNENITVVQLNAGPWK